VSGHTEAAFSVLVELDPLRSVRFREQVPSRADLIDADAEVCLTRIIATPRPGAMAAAAAPAGREPQWTRAARRRRTRYGAIGLAASAAVAVITTLLWASPSAGAPPDQAINVPTSVGQVHSPPQT
jgi:hypothetical protein